MRTLLRRSFLFLLASILTCGLRAQDSCHLRVTLLTCSPGSELYSIFGHTAIRVQDAARGSDEVYNYGTFAFEEGAGFYLKFIRGKLPYYLDIESFPEFLYQYQVEGRSVLEQEVVLDCARKEQLLQALQVNALPENRQYRYDFLFDNCTTRAAEMIYRHAPGTVQTGRVIPADSAHAPTFRNLIHEYLDRGRQPWSKLGIDLLLGARLDRRVTNREAQFLPEKLLQGMEGAQAGGGPLMRPAQDVLRMPPLSTDRPLSPLLVFSLLLALVAALSFVPARGVRAGLVVFDFILFFLAGIVGVVLLFMWFGTDHTVCRNNWNLLWALPTHLLAAPFLRSERRWLHWYLLATIVINAALLLGWIFLPQQLNIGFLPVVLLLLMRAWLIILKPHYHAPHAIEPPQHS
ncbi:Lnb N-terminal periplasmic domain-containing protein [Flaviaesturariibacter terrae]